MILLLFTPEIDCLLGYAGVCLGAIIWILMASAGGS